MNPSSIKTVNGPAWAAVVAASIGCASFGIIVDLDETFKAVSKLLTFYAPTGDLSGKSSVAVLVWLLAWGILHLMWKNRQLQHAARAFGLCIILIVIGLIATFPPIFTRL